MNQTSRQIQRSLVTRFVTFVASACLILPSVGVSAPGPETITFDYTGNVQTFVVPAGVTSLLIEANGAQGGGSSGGSAGGLGARMTGRFAVTPGQVLSIVVGQQGLLQVGGDDQNSSGGGGGTFVFDATGPTLLVAAGGGGGKCNFNPSGQIHAGGAGQITPEGGASSDGNAGGSGGNGGAAGLFSGNPCSGGGAGWLSAGGGPFGGSGFNTWTGGVGFSGGGGGGTGGMGGFGGGGGGGNHYGGGGGGGGYSGGGGGTDPTHGGGGGSYSIGTEQVNTAGIQAGNGSVTLTYTAGVEVAAGDAVLSAPKSLVFPAIRVGKSSGLATITLGNTGDGPIEGLLLRVSGRASNDFKIRKVPASTIAPGGSTTVQILFSPGALGNRRASLLISSNVPAQRVQLSGKGLRAFGSPRLPFR